jgi:dienelactone hydrolase
LVSIHAMKSIVLVLLFFLATNIVPAQVYNIGHVTLTFNDPIRTGGFGSGAGPGRQIQTEVFYPSNTTGEDVEVANGKFPLVIFGHGFLMAWDAYRNIWESIVPRGYIIVIPRTESGMSPNHAEFSDDLSLSLRRMIEAGSGGVGLFKDKISDKSAFMGHSMGGGAAFLAASKNESITTIVALAPMNTNPPATNAAIDVKCPALILSGSADGVTVPSVHHHPIYEALASACKFLVSIRGGAHCYFANASWSCDIGEIMVSSAVKITRVEQQGIMNDYMISWLNHYLREDGPSGMGFLGLLRSDDRITYLESCSLSTLPIQNAGKSMVSVFPNPTRDHLFIHNHSESKSLSYQMADLSGRIFMQGFLSQEVNILDINKLPVGIYLLRLRSTKDEFHYKVVTLE